MYTGIVQAVGRVMNCQPTPSGLRIVVDAGDWGYSPEPGDSVGCSGCCLTLVSRDGSGWVFDAIPETLSKTTLSQWKPGTKINLERPLRIGDGLDGHQVQGHVDGVGKVVQIDDSEGYRVRIGIEPAMMKWMIPKGSITIDGISLTIAALNTDQRWIEVALIPETLERTTLGDRVAGDSVNIEADVMVKTIVHTIEWMKIQN